MIADTYAPLDNVNMHPCLKVTRLDWEDALVEHPNSNFSKILADAEPNLIVGADLVRQESEPSDG